MKLFNKAMNSTMLKITTFISIILIGIICIWAYQATNTYADDEDILMLASNHVFLRLVNNRETIDGVTYTNEVINGTTYKVFTFTKNVHLEGYITMPWSHIIFRGATEPVYDPETGTYSGTTISLNNFPPRGQERVMYFNKGGGFFFEDLILDGTEYNSVVNYYLTIDGNTDLKVDNCVFYNFPNTRNPIIKCIGNGSTTITNSIFVDSTKVLSSIHNKINIDNCKFYNHANITQYDDETLLCGTLGTNTMNISNCEFKTNSLITISNIGVTKLSNCTFSDSIEIEATEESEAIQGSGLSTIETYGGLELTDANDLTNVKIAASLPLGKISVKDDATFTDIIKAEIINLYPGSKLLEFEDPSEFNLDLLEFSSNKYKILVDDPAVRVLRKLTSDLFTVADTTYDASAITVGYDQIEGVAEGKEIIPDDGSIELNLFDFDLWENGDYNETTGALDSLDEYLALRGYLEVEGGSKVSVLLSTNETNKTINFKIREFASDNTFITSTELSNGESVTLQSNTAKIGVTLCSGIDSITNTSTDLISALKTYYTLVCIRGKFLNIPDWVEQGSPNYKIVEGSFKNNINIGTGNFKVAPLNGYFADEDVTLNFKIVCDLSTATITFDTIDVTYNPAGAGSAPLVDVTGLAVNGRKLDDDEYTMTATGENVIGSNVLVTVNAVTGTDKFYKNSKELGTFEVYQRVEFIEEAKIDTSKKVQAVLAKSDAIEIPQTAKVVVVAVNAEENIAIPDEDKEKIESVAVKKETTKEIGIYEVYITRKIDDEEAEKIQPLNGRNVPISLTIPYDENLNYATLKVLHLKDNGSLESVTIDNYKINSSSETVNIAFRVSSFSNFAVYAEEKIVVENNNDGSSNSSSNTSSSSSSVTTITVSQTSTSHKAYMEGYVGGLFGPNDYITRAEVAAVLARLDGRFSETEPYTEKVKDVPISYWAKKYIEFTYRVGSITGQPDGTFDHTGYMAKRDFIAALVRIKGINTIGKTSNFTDVKGRWFEKYVGALEATGLLTGKPDGTFGSDDNITRAEVAKLINIVEGRIPDLSKIENVADSLIKYNDVLKTNWFYADVMEATNLHQVNNFH